jgi:hypothetical protein
VPLSGAVGGRFSRNFAVPVMGTTAAIQTPSGAILTYRRLRKPALGPLGDKPRRHGSPTMTVAPNAPSRPADNWRQVADSAPTLAEPIAVPKWWKNRRSEAVRFAFNKHQHGVKPDMNRRAPSVMAMASRPGRLGEG